MNPIAEQLGVRFEPGTLVQPTGSYADNLLICRFTEPGVGVMTAYRGLLRNNYVITMPGAATMSYDTTAGFRVTPVLQTYDKGSWKDVYKRQGQKHSLQVEIGTEMLSAIGSFSYNDVKGVMKGSDRQVIGGDLNLSYRTGKVVFRDIMSIASMKSNDSPYGEFSTYATLNP